VISDFLYIAVVAAYICISLMLFVFGANLVAFAFRVWRRGPASSDGPAELAESELPLVTVQLPIFNELYVSERIISAVAAFDYPRHLLQIQVLDDSTDETSLIIAQAVEAARRDGHNIEHLHRVDRTGYKAGALAEGMATATGEFIAIFDADFVPEPDFLRRSLPWFDADDVAFVQARWGHVNRDYSWLTRLQALAIDGHFLVEQAGRGQAGYWFNFNGTAGVWRTSAIDDAGGWKASAANSIAGHAVRLNVPAVSFQRFGALTYRSPLDSRHHCTSARTSSNCSCSLCWSCIHWWWLRAFAIRGSARSLAWAISSR